MNKRVEVGEGFICSVCEQPIDLDAAAMAALYEKVMGMMTEKFETVEVHCARCSDNRELVLVPVGQRAGCQ